MLFAEQYYNPHPLGCEAAGPGEAKTFVSRVHQAQCLTLFALCSLLVTSELPTVTPLLFIYHCTLASIFFQYSKDMPFSSGLHHCL